MQKKKYLKKGKSHGQKINLVSGKSAKKTCALCKAQLHGVPHGAKTSATKKLSKTQKRPSAIFGGILCNKCRSMIAEETAKILSGKESLDLRAKPYVEIMLKSV
ncbi:MAG: 50S ribosomal protein L34e [Candidatus Diapherotrites archaeon]|nr:50S ribosomal protein L34e [Candidatus Diapherotrites archaeon]